MRRRGGCPLCGSPGPALLPQEAGGVRLSNLPKNPCLASLGLKSRPGTGTPSQPGIGHLRGRRTGPAMGGSMALGAFKESRTKTPVKSAHSEKVWARLLLLFLFVFLSWVQAPLSISASCPLEASQVSLCILPQMRPCRAKCLLKCQVSSWVPSGENSSFSPSLSPWDIPMQPLSMCPGSSK